MALRRGRGNDVSYHFKMRDYGWCNSNASDNTGATSLALEAALWVQWIWRASWASSGEWEMGHTAPLQWPFVLFPCSKTLNPNHIQKEMLSYINPEWQQYFRQSPGLKCLMSRLNILLFFFFHSFNPQNAHHRRRTFCDWQILVQSLGKIWHSHGHLGRGELWWVITMHESTCLMAHKPQSLFFPDRALTEET